MNRLLASIACALVAVSAAAQNPHAAYIGKYSAIAVSEMERTGVPASITLAQGILESEAGRSPLAVKGNNHFGIKCHADWSGRTMKHDDDSRGECFRVYAAVEQSFRDHSDFLRSRDRYKSLFELDPADYKGWARGLKQAGYATDAGYADKLIVLIENLGLYRYDTVTTVTVQTPAELETPVQLSAEAVRKNYREVVRFSLARKVYTQNGVPFVYAMEGETYESIAAANNLFVKEIRKFNEASDSDEPGPGEVVYIARKKRNAAVAKYVVDSDGEDLREISQRFGVRLDCLRRYNSYMGEGHVLGEGDTVILRKL